MSQDKAILTIGLQMGDVVAGISQLTERVSKFDEKIRQSGGALRKTHQDIGLMAQAANQLRSALGYAGIGMSFAGGVAAMSKASNYFNEVIKESADRIDAFNASTKPLIGLGDNSSNIRSLTKDVLELSRAWGVTAESIADVQFRIKSGAANLPENTQNEIMKAGLSLTGAIGGDLVTASRAIMKMQETYGKEAGGSIQNPSVSKNILRQIWDRGDITMDELASQLPDILPATKAFGWKIEEVSAAIIVASQQLGSMQKGFTAFRNIALRAGQDFSEGKPVETDLLKYMNNMYKSNTKEKLADIIGDRAVVTFFSAFDPAKAEQFRGEMESIKDSLRGVDKVAEITTNRLGDLSTAMSRFRATSTQATENVQLDSNKSQFAQVSDLKYLARERSIKESLPMWAWKIPGISSTAQGLSRAIEWSTGSSQHLLSGARANYQDLKKSNPQAAEMYWRLMGGNALYGEHIGGESGEFIDSLRTPSFGLGEMKKRASKGISRFAGAAMVKSANAIDTASDLLSNQEARKSPILQTASIREKGMEMQRSGAYTPVNSSYKKIPDRISPIEDARLYGEKTSKINDDQENQKKMVELLVKISASLDMANKERRKSQINNTRPWQSERQESARPSRNRNAGIEAM